MLLFVGALVVQGANVVRGQQDAATKREPGAAVVKPRPKRRTPVRATAAPARPREEPLALQWRVYKKKEDDTSEETNPKAIFHAGDQLRFFVTTNYDGYLYVVHEKEGSDGEVILPDSRVRNGQNFVRGGAKYVLPAEKCDPSESPNCWFKVEKNSKQEFFTLIFSRNLVANLPEQVSFASGVIKQSALEKLRENLNQRIRVGSRPATVTGDITSGFYSLWITNVDPRENSQIIFRIAINQSE